MSFDPNHCWYLERRGIRERPNFLLVNAKDTIRLGRRKTSNDKHMAKGIEVSRQHCQFVRSGNAEDWENVRWSIVDLGGTNGTYVNQTRIPQNTPYALNHGDLIGIGHPESTSTRIDDNEKYVYIIKAPVSFSVPEDVMTVPDDEVQNEDDDTPPSSPCQVEIPRIPVPFQKDKAALPLNNDPPLTSGFKESKKLTLICVDPGETNRQEANTPVAVHSSSDKSKINRRSALEHRGLSQLRGHPTPTTSVPSGECFDPLPSTSASFVPPVAASPPTPLPAAPPPAASPPPSPSVSKNSKKLPTSIDNKNERLLVSGRGKSPDPSLVLEPSNPEPESSSSLGGSSPVPEDLCVRQADSTSGQGKPSQLYRNKKRKKIAIYPTSESSDESSVKETKKPRQKKHKLFGDSSTEDDQEQRTERLETDAETVLGSSRRARVLISPLALPERAVSAVVESSSSAKRGERKYKVKWWNTLTRHLYIQYYGRITGSQGAPLLARFHSDSSGEENDEQGNTMDGTDYSDGKAHSVKDERASGCSSAVGNRQTGKKTAEKGVKEAKPTRTVSVMDYEDISSDNEMDKEIRNIGEREIRKACIDSDISSISSSSEIDFEMIQFSPKPLRSDEEREIQEIEEREERDRRMEEPKTEDTKKVKVETSGSGGNPCTSQNKVTERYECDDEVVVIEDSEEEDNYLSQSQSFLAPPDSGADSSPDSEVEELFYKKGTTINFPLKKEKTEAEVTESEVTDSSEAESDIEILNNSQTPLYDRIKDAHLKAEPMDFLTVESEDDGVEDELESQSLLQDDDDADSDQALVEDIMGKMGSLADENIVRNAIRQDSTTGKPQSFQNIFELVRDDVERVLVDTVASKLSCTREQVEKCLQLKKQDNQLIETINLEDLKDDVARYLASKDRVDQPQEDGGLDSNAQGGLDSSAEGGLDSNAQGGLDSNAQGGLDSNAQGVVDRSTAQKTVDYQSVEDKKDEYFNVDELLDEYDEDEERETMARVDTGITAQELLSDDNTSKVAKPEALVVKPPPSTKAPTAPSPHSTRDNVGEKGKLNKSRPVKTALDKDKDFDQFVANHRQQQQNKQGPPLIQPLAQPARQGPQLIQPLAQPARRAFNRGISATKIEQMEERRRAKDSVDVSNKVVDSPQQLGEKEKPKPQFYGKTTSGYSAGRRKTKEEKLLERKQKLKEVAEKNKKPEKEKVKSSVSRGKMKVSVPKNQNILESLQTEEAMKPPSRIMVEQKKAGVIPGGSKLRPPSAQVNKRRSSEPDSPKGKRERPRRPSEGGFLGEEAKMDFLKINQPKKKEKYKQTEDGYVPNKMSHGNIDYNVCSQDISKMEVSCKPLQFAEYKDHHNKALPKTSKHEEDNPADYDQEMNSSAVIKRATDLLKQMPEKSCLKYGGGGIPSFQEASRGEAKKKLSWREVLVRIRYIEKDNKGQKISGKDFVPPEPKVKRVVKELTVDHFIKAILQWSTRWVKEQKQQRFPPNVHGKFEMITLPDTFANWEEYRNIFFPLMLHEVWSLLCREVEEREEAGREEVIPVCIQEVSTDKKAWRFQCLALLTESEIRRDIASDGTLVVIKLSFLLRGSTESKKCKEIRPYLGYVRAVSRQSFVSEQQMTNLLGEADNKRVTALRKEADKTRHRKNPRHLVTYTIETKHHEKLSVKDHICTEKPNIVQLFARIKPELRKVQAMLDLNNTPLFMKLLAPDKRSLSVSYGSEHLHPTIKDLPALASLNSTQKRVIVGSSRACLDFPDRPQVALIQGPPGTGKSSTIVGIVLQLLAARGQSGGTSELPRILLVAPSNAAVDELALKLIRIKSTLADDLKFNILRLGITKSVHPEVKKYTFDETVKRMVEAEMRHLKASKTLEMDEKLKQEIANSLYAEKEAAEKQGNMDLANKLNRDYKEVMKAKEQIKLNLNRPLDRERRYELESKSVLKLITGADIILSTLSSCLHPALETHLIQQKVAVPRSEGGGGGGPADKVRPVSICIMDEASQCVEPEALIPLKFKFQKLIMVGDSAQLPATVISQTAKNHGYQKSLFKRLFQIMSPSFKLANSSTSEPRPSSPLMRLETQYRMHPAVLDWPSRYFYGGLISSGGQERESPLNPYVLLNLQSTESNSKGSIWNPAEETMAVDIVQAVEKILADSQLKEPLNIGVLTFYQKQKQMISLELQNRRLNSVDVNTVDGYQGSERDVIVISCVRAGVSSIGFLHDPERLNVALTRAKFSQILVGDFNTLQDKSDMWKQMIENARTRGVLHETSDVQFCLEKALKKQKD